LGKQAIGSFILQHLNPIGDPAIRSFWQSPVATAEINRRITGDPELSPLAYFVHKYCPESRERGLSLGWSDGKLERELLSLGGCRQLVALASSADQIEPAASPSGAEPPGLLKLIHADVETWRPAGRFDLVVANSVLHRIEALEDVFDLLDGVLTTEGLVYVDGFVGPSRFQWTDKQLEIVNRLLDRLSTPLRLDLSQPDHGARGPVTKPTIAAVIAGARRDAARSEEIPGLLRARLDVVEERPWGGAIFHQLFNRMMGNFIDQDDLVRVIMELDAILTEEGVVASDYLWGVYRLAHDRPRTIRRSAQTDGRLESIEGDSAIGWAANPRAPEERLSLDLYVDHKLVAKTVADLPRADLAREGIGDGAHAFRVGLPSWVRDGRQHSISVVIAALGATLPPARAWEQRNRGLPDHTEFVWARYDPRLPPLPSARVLAGRDGWAFPCDDAVGSIEQMLGHLTLTEPELADYRALIQGRAQDLAEVGIRYIFAIAPAKASVHPERLPESSPALGPPQLGRQLLDSLTGAAVTSPDLLEPLVQAARSERQLYYKRDPDWNYEGALIAAQRLLSAACELDVAGINPEIGAITWLDKRFEGALAGRPAVGLQNGRLRALPPTGFSEVARLPDEQALGIRRVAVPEALKDRESDLVAIENPARPGGPSALVLHDPGGRRLLPFVGAAFPRSVWVSTRHLDPRLIEASRPTVVLQVLDESLLVRVPYNPSG
jgi:SAM-dependent methyltransferase